MKCPPALPAEKERLQALSDYGLGENRPLPSLDAVVQLAARSLGMPMAAVNMIGSDHVFFAASAGIEPGGEGVDMARDVSFCAHAITQDGVMVVSDARLDERFHDNPLVTGSAGLRFYAGVPLLSPQGHPLGALCVLDQRPHHDFSDADRQHLRELAKIASDRLELRRIELSANAMRPFDAYARNSPTAVAWFDGSGAIVAWNDSAATLFGYEPSEGIGRRIDELLAEPDRAEVNALIARAARAGSVDGLSMPERICGLRKDGSEFLLGIALFCWNENGRLMFNVHLQDRTARLLKQEELHRLASTDMLTGLPNRTGLYRRMESALLESSELAVLMLDLDGFKDVNDTLGHGAGDGLLCEIARRLKQCIGPEDLVARMGGDEFAILLAGVGDKQQAVDRAQRLVEVVAEPVMLDGSEVRVAACCGIAIAGEHGREALELVGDADLALYRAKKEGRGQVCVFLPALREEANTRRLLGTELHRAVSEGEFVLFYQPQVRLSDGALVGAEALIRWLHPQQGLLSPAAFLPALETGSLAAAVGAWVLDEACAQAAYWRARGAPDLRIGVNLFAAQLRLNDLIADVLSALRRHGLPPSALELEVTENIVLDNDDLVLDTLAGLRQAGVGIAFDDFGTGYASLSLLKKYPLTRLKIDRSFVKHVHESDRDASVVRAIVDMTRSFGLDTIAEGIENERQRDRLYRMGCQEGQGYLFSQPLPALVFSDAYGIGDGRPLAIRA
ncbi:EAL domain-containing protein [Thermomonas brevis]|uniref:EAL domain-containing protein n=1 Tax=Thermomonas brevis TaxID=215691 RepID=A0A7G9QT68_9GAMM|nr:EAL domain-containing protein [Thermomonas brevis]QNN46543.1 EAL domain-containing protein [Thermomonas brevis]